MAGGRDGRAVEESPRPRVRRPVWDQGDGAVTVRRLDVICPVYREEEGIVGFHAELSAVLARLADRYESRVTYVLDPAPDQTEQRLAEICAASPNTRTLVLSRRFGHQAA